MNALYDQLNKAQLMGDQTMVRLLLDQITYIQTAGSLETEEPGESAEAPKNKRNALLAEFAK